MYKNMVLCFGFGLCLFPGLSGSAWAAESGARASTVKASQPYYMHLPEAVVVWHKIKGEKLDPIEYSRLYADDLAFNTEFEQKRKIKEVAGKHAQLEKNLLAVTTFTFVMQFKLKDYDFEKGIFPTNLSTGEQLIGIGSVNLYHNDTKKFDKFLLHYDRVTLKYALSVKMPDALDRLEMPEVKAEELIGKLSQDRTVDCVFSGVIDNATESVIVKGREDLDFEDKSGNVNTKEVVLRELDLKLLRVDMVVPDSGAPGKILKTWLPEYAGQFEKI